MPEIILRRDGSDTVTIDTTASRCAKSEIKRLGSIFGFRKNDAGRNFEITEVGLSISTRAGCDRDFSRCFPGNVTNSVVVENSSQ